MLPYHLNVNIYVYLFRDALLELLENVPELLEDVPLIVTKHIWFQHDGLPPHVSLAVREYF